jgi:hypothetical protein
VVFLIIGLLAGGHGAYCQAQLVLLRNEKVLVRYNPGDEFMFKVKKSKAINRSYINNLSDTSVTVHDEIISFHSIDRIYFSRKRFYNDAGVKMVSAGVILFLADQLNVNLIQGNKASVDKGVAVASIALIATGLPMALIKKKSQVLNYKYRLLTVRKGSMLYRE